MTSLYRIRIAPSFSFDEAWDILERSGIQILYGSEEEELKEIFCYLPSSEALNIAWILDCQPHQLPEIDWEDQWAHSKFYQDGLVQIDFKDLGRDASTLHLRPGAGFGDLSHPTTRMMLQMLAQALHGETVVDIGCGSGILTLAAAAMGAHRAIGIDIDPEARVHSQENAVLNQLEAKCSFLRPDEFRVDWVVEKDQFPLLILMNMIRTEQVAAWDSLPALHGLPSKILTSGIRREESKEYLEQAQLWGWELLEEREEDGWMAYSFAFI